MITLRVTGPACPLRRAGVKAAPGWVMVRAPGAADRHPVPGVSLPFRDRHAVVPLRAASARGLAAVLSALDTAAGQAAVWSGVWSGGSSADWPADAQDDGPPRDLRLEWVTTAGCADLPVRPGDADAGALMSELLPETTRDGRLDAYCAVLTTGRPWRQVRPAVPGSGADDRRIVVERAGPGLVVARWCSAASRDDQTVGRRGGDLRWQRAFSDAPVGVAVSTYDGRILEANRAFATLVGRSAEQLIGASFHAMAHPEDDHVRLDRSRLRRTGTAWMRKRYVHSSGGTLWLRVAASLVVEEGEQRLLAFFEDATAEHEAHSTLAHRAEHDALTGLPNRERLARLTVEALAAQHAGSCPGVALLYVDLDDFKTVNDSLGHDAGDQVLRTVATRLREAVGGAGTVARVGGDEFVVLTREPASARALGERLLRVLDQTVGIAGRTVRVGASIGIALTDAAEGAAAGADPGTLLRDGDAALYAAKAAGRGRCEVFGPALRARALARLDGHAELLRALQEGQLEVHYQPIVSAHGHQLRGFEALVRWRHPQRGLLLPAAFLETAADAGLLVPLGRAVLTASCAQLARWHVRAPGLRLSVNVAAEQLAVGDLVTDVRAVLAETGVPAASLTIEITESTLVVSDQEVVQALARLRADGCEVALDDFGTGYSSLAYLRDLPVDAIKIDRSFVTGAGTPANDGALLAAVVALGRSLGLDVVVEGIETAAERDAAVTAGAELLQGFLFGRPLPAEQAGLLLP